MHNRTRGTNFCFADSAIGLGQMSHRLKKRPNILFGQAAHSGALVLEFAVTRRETTVKLVADKQAK